MESGIDMKQATASSVDDGRDGVGAGGDNLLAAEGALRLIESHQSLQQAILKYESIVEHLERVCNEKVIHLRFYGHFWVELS